MEADTLSCPICKKYVWNHWRGCSALNAPRSFPADMEAKRLIQQQRSEELKKFTTKGK